MVNGSMRRAIAAASVGNILEWYDFVVYGYLGITIAKLFFPTKDATMSLLLAFLTYGVGYLMRPLGSLVLGSVTDKYGRKLGLSITVLLMALGTVMIGLAPTYAVAGVFAPLFVLVARLIQGFSAGGEIGGATAFMIEHAPANARGYYGSLQQATQAVALLCGSLLGAAVTGLLTQDQLLTWGWRIPFLIGFIIGPVGFYIRSQTTETDDFLKVENAKEHSPIADVFSRHWAGILAGFGVVITWTVAQSFFLFYMPTFAVKALGLPQVTPLITTSICLGLLAILGPIFGSLSDRVGRRPFLLASAALFMVMAYPTLHFVVQVHSLAGLFMMQIIAAVLLAAFAGPAPAMLAEVFPTAVRSSGISIAYTLAVTIFGGFAVVISTWLIAVTGDKVAPGWYVTGAAALSLILIATFYRERRGVTFSPSEATSAS